MIKVLVTVERLVRLQRRVEEAREMAKFDYYRTRAILVQVHEELDSIIMESQPDPRD